MTHLFLCFFLNIFFFFKGWTHVLNCFVVCFVLTFNSRTIRECFLQKYDHNYIGGNLLYWIFFQKIKEKHNLLYVYSGVNAYLWIGTCNIYHTHWMHLFYFAKIQWQINMNPTRFVSVPINTWMSCLKNWHALKMT